MRRNVWGGKGWGKAGRGGAEEDCVLTIESDHAIGCPGHQEVAIVVEGHAVHCHRNGAETKGTLCVCVCVHMRVCAHACMCRY